MQKNDEISFKDLFEKHSLYFWIDMLQIYFKKEDILFLDSLVFEIDEDNSNSAKIELSKQKLHYTKIHIKGFDYWFKFDFVIDNEIVDWFTINFVRETKKINDKVVLIVYSQLLTLFENNNLDFDLLEFLQENFNLKDYPNYRRLDFCLDLSVSKSYILPHFTGFISKIWKWIDWFHETYYTRNIQNEKNTKMLTRIYDKKLDTFKKKKFFLYTHLDKNKFVNRVEIEIRPDYAKAIKLKLKDLLYNQKIKQDLFIQYLNLDLIELSKIDRDKITLLKFDNEKYDLSNNFQKIWFIPKNYLCYSNWYLRNILNQTWYKGFFQAIIWVYFDDDNRIIRGPKWELKYLTDRNPEKIINELISYLKQNLHFPQQKINKLLKPHITTPILILKK